jgi:transposase-like protein
LEAAIELVKEGLSIEQIARVLKLPLELVQEQIQKPE